VIVVLLLWTGIGFVWWLIAVWLVQRGPGAHAHDESPADPARPLISIFKPVASPLGRREYEALELSLASVIADADSDCEVLIGANPAEAERLAAFTERMRAACPEVRIELVVEPVEASLAHPKVRWNEKLARHARGSWWFWSDADMTQPAGTMAALRTAFLSGTGMVTLPYVVKKVEGRAEVLDALYVNVEFYPGVLLLGLVDRLANGFGAGMLFAADEFRDKVDWAYLGSQLADDFVLGSLLPPVRLASTVLETAPTGGGWRDALLHYLRWQKTVRWCQPGGFAAQLIILPVIGWLIALVLQPSWTTVGGLMTVLLMDLVTVVLIFNRLACRLSLMHLPAIIGWSVLRGLVWIACWFPWPVIWRDRRCWSPTLYDAAGDLRVDKVVGG